MIYGIIAIGAILFIICYVESNWCSTCRKFSAKSRWEVTEILGISTDARIGKDYAARVSARIKRCSHCSSTKTIGATVSLCNGDDADIHRNDLEATRLAGPN